MPNPYSIRFNKEARDKIESILGQYEERTGIRLDLAGVIREGLAQRLLQLAAGLKEENYQYVQVGIDEDYEPLFKKVKQADPDTG